MTVYRQAMVYVQDILAGKLKETEEGYLFYYDKEYLKQKNAVPVSLTLPLSEKEYTSGILFPFFDGLIPEGWLVQVVSKNWKLNTSDRFGLLLASCRDCIGDVSLKENFQTIH